jgi:flagellar biosynthesis/type III secretory pathway chaperone
MAIIYNMPVIKDLLKNLTDHFDTASDLLSKQIQCVVKHRLEELQEAIEQQNSVNSTINALEDEFRQALILSFNSIKVKTKTYSLPILLPYCDPSDHELAELREGLKHAIQKTQTKQVHLLQLLQFAQDHVADTIRAIFQLSDGHSTHYKATGKKATSHVASKLINQTV